MKKQKRYTESTPEYWVINSKREVMYRTRKKRPATLFATCQGGYVVKVRQVRGERSPLPPPIYT